MIRFFREALVELKDVSAREQTAISEALLKLESLGDQLGAPHSSSVKGVAGCMRELRPRRGASAWRVLYRRIGDEIVVGAIAPEAMKDRRGFNRAVEQALTRLEQYDTESD